MASLKRGASYLPVSTSDLDGSAWEARARSDFMAKVTSLVFVQALVACAAALAPTLSTGVRDFVLSHAAMAYIALFAPLVLIFVMFAVRHTYPWNYFVMTLFTLCTSYSLGVVSLAYAPAAVLAALALTASAMGLMALLAHLLRHRDLSLFGLGLVAVGWVFLVALVVLSFFRVAATGSILIGASGAALFCAYTVFDLWLMMQPARGLAVDEYMLAAMNLYLDFINIFLFVLQAIGGAQRE